MRIKNCNCEIPFWDECNKNKVKWYKKGKMKRILRKRWIAKILNSFEKTDVRGQKIK
jgi:hypothetical protein